MRPFIVGIAGGSGSGKTTLIRLLQAELGSEVVTVISQDDYYRPLDEQLTDDNGQVNFDLPDSIDSHKLGNDIQRLVEGESLQIMRYTFNNINDLADEITLHPRPVLVIEGLFVFHFPTIKEHIDLKIFVDAHPRTRFERRLKRDKEERGYEEQIVHYQWKHHVEPAFRSYLLPYRDSVDIIIYNELDMRNGIKDLIGTLREEVTPRLTS